jgi:hypothetical protein
MLQNPCTWSYGCIAKRIPISCSSRTSIAGSSCPSRIPGRISKRPTARYLSCSAGRGEFIESDYALNLFRRRPLFSTETTFSRTRFGKLGVFGDILESRFRAEKAIRLGSSTLRENRIFPNSLPLPSIQVDRLTTLTRMITIGCKFSNSKVCFRNDGAISHGVS